MKSRIVFHIKNVFVILILVVATFPDQLFLLVTNLTEENGNGRVVVHCHLDAFTILITFKTRGDHITGLLMGKFHPLFLICAGEDEGLLGGQKQTRDK
jgi:hypothetical protein